MVEEKILVNTLKTNYKIAGSGPAILILHGWESNSERWKKVGELLAKNGFKIIIPDLPGFGRTSEPPVGWGLDNYCDFVKRLVIDFNLEKFFLLGHSFGGTVAAKFALQYPEKIRKLFLISAAIIRKKTLKKEFIKKTAKSLSFLPSSIKKIIYQRIIKSDYPLNQGIMRETYLKVIGEDITRQLFEIIVPTIIIWGQDDKVTPLSDALFLQKQIPGSQIEIIAKAGHRINMETPKKLAKIILKHLK